ncbi:MAG: hypothetical protein K2W95_10905 [Candidatus Obscuribacterales bacterium]|nr:hypothetical protein [Candidatus Obscuribacterales bacterium]
MSDYCKYFAMGGDKFYSMLTAVGKLKSVQGVLDPFIIDEWDCAAARQAGLGKALDELGKSSDRFSPLDAKPVELQSAWKLLAATLSSNAEKMAWAKSFKRAGMTAPTELNRLIEQLHETKCLEVLLPTPLSGKTKGSILSLCRFLEKHNNGSVWILGVELAADTGTTEGYKIG